MPKNFSRYTGYEIAQIAEELYEKEGIPPDEFLDLVYPGHKIRDAAGYLKRLATGKQKADPLMKASQRDSGRAMTIWYKVGEKVDRKTGEIVDDVRTARINVPYGYSRLDMVDNGGSRLRTAVDAYFKKTYQKRERASSARARDRKRVAKAAAIKEAKAAGEEFDEEEFEEEWAEEETDTGYDYTPVSELPPDSSLYGFSPTHNAGAPVNFK